MERGLFLGIKSNVSKADPDTEHERYQVLRFQQNPPLLATHPEKWRQGEGRCSETDWLVETNWPAQDIVPHPGQSGDDARGERLSPPMLIPMGIFSDSRDFPKNLYRLVYHSVYPFWGTVCHWESKITRNYARGAPDREKKSFKISRRPRRLSIPAALLWERRSAAGPGDRHMAS